jgi:hypothetical protein
VNPFIAPFLCGFASALLCVAVLVMVACVRRVR